MDVSGGVFAIFLATLWVLYAIRRNALLFLWPIILLVFPTMRTMVAGAPIYWYDVASLAVLVCLLKLPAPSGMRWGVILCVLVTWSALIVPTVRYGFMPESLWLWGHALIAWLMFPAAIRMGGLDENHGLRKALFMGIAGSLLLLAFVAVAQEYSPAMDYWIRIAYYADQARSAYASNLGQSFSIESASGRATRVIGPYLASTTFAGVVLTAMMSLLLLGQNKRAWEQMVPQLSGLVVLVLTFTRHTLVALTVSLLIIAILGNRKQKTAAMWLGAVAALVITMTAIGSYWHSRLAPTGEGILQDQNIRARLIYGPQRMVTYLESHWDAAITGVGYDPTTLFRYGLMDLETSQSFASNGFLLVLYCWGVAGVALFVYLWASVSIKALKADWSVRGLACAVTAAGIIITASDNYPYFNEVAISMLMINAGLVVAIPRAKGGMAECIQGLTTRRPAAAAGRPNQSSLRNK